MYSSAEFSLVSSFPLVAEGADPVPALPSADTLLFMIGIAILIVCVSRRKMEIGGWLLYFYIQLYMAVIVSVFTVLVTFDNYAPSTWVARPSLYIPFLLSSAPGVLINIAQLVWAERLRLSRDYRHVRTVRLILWLDLAAAVLAVVIHTRLFHLTPFFTVIALAWPLIWLPYFHVSRRVDRVFRTKDWIPAPAPSMVA